MGKTTILLFLATFAVAHAERDWSKIKTFGPHSPDGPGSRIVGGQVAEPNSFPYQAALFISAKDGNIYFCGGSLISTKYVLTAAHCVDKAKSVQVLLGAHNVTLEEEPNRIILTSKKITVHKWWSMLLLKNDIALIELPEAVQLNEYIQTIALPKKNDGSHAGDQSVISGWGKTSDPSKSISDVLYYVQVKVMSNLVCGTRFIGRITPKHICTSGDKKRNPCNGDSGGPLVVENKQVGIVSFGFAKCSWGWPGVYTRVSKYLNWISNNSDIKIQ